MDTHEGRSSDPISLHKYLYAGDEPVDRVDPSGKDFGLADAAIAGSIATTLDTIDLNVGMSIMQGLMCQQQGTCKNGTTGALFNLAFTALAATVLIGALAVLSNSSKEVPLVFSQLTASPEFDSAGDFAGETIGSLAAKIRNGTISPSSVTVNYVVRDGSGLIANNRSALALLRADVPQSEWNLVDMTGNAAWETRITNHLNNNGLTNEGSEIIRITGSEVGKNASNLE